MTWSVWTFPPFQRDEMGRFDGNNSYESLQPTIGRTMSIDLFDVQNRPALFIFFFVPLLLSLYKKWTGQLTSAAAV
jgi:hypothetical protein